MRSAPDGRPVPVPSGALVLSLDTELAWGRIASADRSRYLPMIRRARLAIDALLGLLDEYHVPATWAFVGAMLEEEQGEPEAALELFHPGLTWTRLRADAALRDRGVSLAFGRDIFDRVRARPTPHELASHSYSHMVFERAGLDTSRADFAAMQRIARRLGFSPTSFVYPQNRVGHEALLADHGFSTFRTPAPDRWPSLPHRVRRAVDIGEQVLGLSPITTLPRLDGCGLLQVDGHLPFFVPGVGMTKRLPVAGLARRAIRGLEDAIRSRRLLHLWLHPFNFGHRLEEHVRALADVLALAVRARERGDLAVLTMGDVRSFAGVSAS